MKRKLVKTLASFLAVLMLFTCVQISVFATDDTVTVSFACSDNEIIMPYTELEVRDGLAEEYGFENVATADHNGVAITEATFFDALIAAHIAYYGDEFTADTAKNYIGISSGYLTKAFGKSATASSFIINKVMPNDGIYNEAYHSYTGYASDIAQLKDGDDITFFFYQDLDMWSDWFTWFDKDEYTTTVGESFNVNIKGYCAMWYGFNSIDDIMSNYAANVASADIYVYSENGECVSVGKTDSNGNATLTFDKAGEYTLYAKGVVSGAYGDSPVIYPWCKVVVNSDAANLGFFQWILNLLRTVIDFIKNIF